MLVLGRGCGAATILMDDGRALCCLFQIVGFVGFVSVRLLMVSWGLCTIALLHYYIIVRQRMDLDLLNLILKRKKCVSTKCKK